MKKPPPIIGKKPEPKNKVEAVKAVAKPTGKPQVVGVEEEEGSGLSKEEAIEKVVNYFDAEHVSKFDESKW